MSGSNSTEMNHKLFIIDQLSSFSKQQQHDPTLQILRLPRKSFNVECSYK